MTTQNHTTKSQPYSTTTADGVPYTPVQTLRPPLFPALAIVPMFWVTVNAPKLTRSQRNENRRTKADHGGRTSHWNRR